jgi:hypothetical protein
VGAGILAGVGISAGAAAIFESIHQAAFSGRRAVMTSTFPRTLSFLALVCLASTVQAESDSASIRDDAGLFQAASIARAERGIAAIRETFGHNLIVRTVASVSPQQRHLFRFLRTPQVNRILEEQARKYADESGVRGIYVVICNSPRDVHVIVRPEDDPGFTRHDAEALRRTLARRLADHVPDAALLALVEQVQALLQAHATRGASSLANDFVLASVVGGGMVLWILLVMIRFNMRARQPADSEGQDTAMQARSKPALLGAMFGYPAGMWIYDKLYPCRPGAALPLCEPEPEATPQREDEHVEATDAGVPPAEKQTEDAPVSP